MKTAPNLILVLVSLGLYGIALFLPALQFEARPPVKGITTLLWGWWGLLTYDFPWLANIAYFIAVVQIFLGKRASALKYAIAALVLGLLSLLVKKWFFSEAEGTPVKNLGSAFYFWMGSFVALLAIYVFPSEA
jgi:hypothetical protein